MGRPETLIAAIAKNATYVANLDAAAKKKPLTAKQKASRASAVEKFDTYVLEYANLLAGTPTAPPVTPTTPTPTVPGDAAALNQAWDHPAARTAIQAKLVELGSASVDAQIAALGPELAGKAIALGRFGAPGDQPDVDFSLADPYGGFWMVTGPTRTDTTWRMRAYKGSVITAEEWYPTMEECPGVKEFAAKHGIRYPDFDGPA